MKTELCWLNTKTAKGQACRSLVGDLTGQRPRSQMTGAKVLHSDKVQVQPAWLIGSMRTNVPAPGAAVSPEARALDSRQQPPICCCPPGW